jgi:RNA polymerase sigma-70 factor (ECF subfamily)
VRSIATGDQHALHALYERSHRLVFTLAMRITRSRESAEEVTLDVFHEIWRQASRYDPADGTVIGWIMNRARSRAIDRLRFEQRKKRIGTQPESAAPELCSHGLLDTAQQKQFIRDALVHLTGPERQAIEAAYFLELSHAEAAVRLGEPLGTVKTRLRSAIRKLRLVLLAGAKS